MSKLDELIAKYCPDGVEYKKLGDIATIQRGGNLQKKDLVDEGIPCIHYGQIYTKYGLFANNTLTFISPDNTSRQRFAKTNDIVMAVTSENIDDVCKCVAWMGDEDVAVSGHTAIISHNQDAKYLSYYFHSSHFYTQKRKLAHGTKVIEVTPSHLENVKIPVPPLEVQREIVRVLDNFTFLTAELTAELTARRKQYEYYRDSLLSFDKVGGVRKVKLGDICKVESGGTPSKKNPEYWIGGTIKWLGSSVCQNKRRVDNVTDYITNEGLNNSSAKIQCADTTLIAMVGATIGKVAYLTFEATTNQNVAALYPLDENELKQQYLYYACTKLYEKFIDLGKNGFTMASLNFIRNLEIDVPSIEEQGRIVNTLDRLETLCNDISVGIPAEIEARQKQYEYYRDRLLTFDKKPGA